MPHTNSSLPPASLERTTSLTCPPEQPLPPALKKPTEIDALIKQSVVQLTRHGTAHVNAMSVNAGNYDLRFPGIKYHIDFNVPQDNAIKEMHISAGVKPTLPEPTSITRQAWNWTKSFFVTPPPPPPPTRQATEQEAPYLRPFRATLAKPVTARVANLTGWAWIDWCVRKFIKVECTGFNVEAGGKPQLEGALRFGLLKVPLWGVLEPLHRLFFINMNTNGILDEPILFVRPSTGNADTALATQMYVLDLLSHLLGNLHAEMHAPGTLEVYDGVRYTPEKIAHDLRFTPKGVHMEFATHGELDVSGKKISARVRMPMTVDLKRGVQAPMHLEIGASEFNLRGGDGGAGRWWLNGAFGYDDGAGKSVDAAEPLVSADEHEIYHDAVELQNEIPQYSLTEESQDKTPQYSLTAESQDKTPQYSRTARL